MVRTQRRPSFRRRKSVTREEYNRHRDYRWEVASKAYRKSHPVCVYCERMGRVVGAQAVDHIIPHRGDYDLFWDTDNWQSLCITCHGRKSQRESIGLDITWTQTPSCYVIFGSPGSGKTTFWQHRFRGKHWYDNQPGLRIGYAAVWDMDYEADRLNFHRFPSWPHELDVLKERRSVFISDVIPRFAQWAFVVTNMHIAYRVAQETKATLVEAWCPDHVRRDRLKNR